MRVGKPILMNGEMVRATLEGRKTQTRRVMSPQLSRGWVFGTASSADIRYGEITSPHPRRGRFGVFIKREVFRGSGKFEHDLIPCPCGQPGDLIWVREAWTTRKGLDSVSPCEISETQSIGYLADLDEGPWLGKGRPSIHMPRWASRITLEITGVRVERLQDISEADATAEGAAVVSFPGLDAERSMVDRFRVLWNSIYGAGAWESNPWVWVIEYRTHHMNIDALIQQREVAA